jgi:predicted phage terminase large subunit-like protein
MLPSKNSKPVYKIGLDDRTARKACEADQLDFTRYFFKLRQNASFLVNWHHRMMADKLQAVMDGKIKNLIINLPPGGTKTEMVIINFIARGLALNPWCRFLHLSYSDDLALSNSKAARDLVQLDEFQRKWPIPIADDAKSKKRWNVLVDGKEAGGVYATSLGGQVTGFRAGHMRPGFNGALLVDDPLKPNDAFSKAKLNEANRLLINTVKSRLANPDVPIILIMQRIAEEDPSGFVMAGNLGLNWEKVIVPAVIDDDYVSKLEPKYQSLLTRDAEGRFSYWPYKERIGDLLQMESGQAPDTMGGRMSRHVFSSQYQQAPRAIGGNIIKGEWFHRYTILPKIKYRRMYADTAQKTKERNDYSVLAVYGLGDDNKLYLLDQLRGKWEAPELENRTKAFWAKHSVVDPSLEWVKEHPADERWQGQLRKLLVEDKASGTGLIQKIKLLNQIPIEGIERHKDKLTRAMDAQGYLEAGMVCVPENAPFTSDFIEEAEAFTADDSHPFDDQLDPLFDAVQDMLSTKNKLATWAKLIEG